MPVKLDVPNGAPINRVEINGSAVLNRSATKRCNPLDGSIAGNAINAYEVNGPGTALASQCMEVMVID